jgi:hypothetical protein
MRVAAGGQSLSLSTSQARTPAIIMAMIAHMTMEKMEGIAWRPEMEVEMEVEMGPEMAAAADPGRKPAAAAWLD